MEGELVRVERQLILLVELLEKVLARQEEIIELLSPPATYPASTGGTITVK